MMSQFAPLKRVPSYVELAEVITSQILSGKIRPGDLLPIEKEMAEQFQVNRSTLREGLRVLEESDLVRRVGKRLKVQQPSHHTVAQATGRALVLHEVSFSDIYELGMLLFPASAELAAQRANAEDKKNMKENIDLTQKTLQNPDELASIDVRFFQLVAAASGNKAMLMSLEALSLIFYAGFYSVLKVIPVASERLFQSHSKIYDAICAGESDKARHWMEKHVEDFKRGFEAAGFSLKDRIGESELVIQAFQQRHQ